MARYRNPVLVYPLVRLRSLLSLEVPVFLQMRDRIQRY